LRAAFSVDDDLVLINPLLVPLDGARAGVVRLVLFELGLIFCELFPSVLALS
jgi:hypothetical protein